MCGEAAYTDDLPEPKGMLHAALGVSPVAHGGATVGYSLYLKGGRAVFALHQPGKEVVRITSPDAIPAKAAIDARIAADGAMTLSLDGKQVARGKADGTLGKQPAESFCVGHDDKVTVDDYDGKAQFKGAIRNLKISVTSPSAR